LSLVRDGIPASPGIVIGPAHVLRWEVPQVPHRTVQPEEVEREVERFEEARQWAKSRIREIRDQAASRLGEIEAQIFEPQLLMLDDPELRGGTIAYIRDNRLSAARAFQLCMLEFQADWRRTGNPMIMDRLNDLLDVEVHVIRRLLGLPDPDLAIDGPESAILIARDLTPTLTVQLDRNRIIGIATDAGTQTSHSAILARALNLPAVAGLTDLAEIVETGQRVILDGRTGRVIVDPTDEELEFYREKDIKVREWEQQLLLLAHLDAVTPDGQAVILRGNIDLPSEAENARDHGARGIGLFRTEFLVVGRNAMPQEDEQYRAYRQVAEAFPGEAVIIRTFDLGGDKFPTFLNMPPEENPFLGWRAIRVCLDVPELFRAQLRAILRATAHGDVRILLPFISSVDEVHETRAMLEEEKARLAADGIPFDPDYKLGVMIETPAAALIAAELARHADFLAIGTNDLVQYTLAVDRGNARLAPRYAPFHPAVLELLRGTAAAGHNAGIEVSVCGELAAHPLGVYLFLGLGIHALSVGPASLPEVKKIIRSIPAGDARATVEAALKAGTQADVTRILESGISKWLDLSPFAGSWNLSPQD